MKKALKEALKEAAKDPASLSTLLEIVADVRAKHGATSIMQATGALIEKVPVLSTGSLLLNRALGVGGYPYGRIIEVYGPEASGKTTLALHAIAELQAVGGIAAFIDAEHAIDMQYARNLGVETDKLLLSQPDSGEQALSIVEALIETKRVKLIVVDSVAALVPQSELEGEMEDSSMGVQSRLMSKALRKLTAIAHHAGAIVFFINQLRSKIGVIFGSPEVTSGGNALKYYASVRLDIRRREQIKLIPDTPTGNRTHIKVVKNKLAPPFREIDIDIIWGKGIDRTADLIVAGMEREIITRAGPWLSFGDTKLGQGLNNAASMLDTDLELRTRLIAAVIA